MLNSILIEWFEMDNRLQTKAVYFKQNIAFKIVNNQLFKISLLNLVQISFRTGAIVDVLLLMEILGQE